MGIINLTDDSFHSESRVQKRDDILRLAEKHLQDGAQILDLGASSSRPGSLPVEEALETDKIQNAVLTILKEWPEAIISVDSWRSSVCSEALLAGAKMVNDISAGNLDPEILVVVGKYRCPYIMMHMKESPSTMNQSHNLEYQNLTSEIIRYFSLKIKEMEQLNIHQMIIDPGFGFSKNLHQNYTLLRELNFLKIIEKPILVGISRKFMIQKIIGDSSQNALNGTTAAHILALQQGAQILRVHDTKEAIEAIAIHNAFLGKLS